MAVGTRTFLQNVAGLLQEARAIVASAGAADADKIVATDSSGRIDQSFMPTGIGADTATLTASEALAAGDFVNVWNNAGAFAVRKADGSTSGKEAHGFVTASVASAGAATVYFEGTNAAVTGQTPGNVFLSATVAGKTQATAPTGTGQTVQRLGSAVSATAINVETHLPIVLA